MLGNWRTYGKNVFEYYSNVYLELWEGLEDQLKAGTAKLCFCKDFYEGDPAKQGIDDLRAAFQAGGLIEAGAETTSTTLNLFIRTICRYPNVVRKAHEELDRVVGVGRLPNWDDEKTSRI